MAAIALGGVFTLQEIRQDRTEVGPEAAGSLTEEVSTSTAILMFTFLYHKIHDQLTTAMNL